MRIERRKYTKWSNGIVLALPSTFTYLFGKLMGTQYNNLEFLWWIVIPLLWIIYFALQFKIVRRSNGVANNVINPTAPQ